MYKHIRYFAPVCVLLCLSAALVSCTGRDKPEEGGSNYIYTPAQTTSAETTAEAVKDFVIDNSWHENYEVSYKYYNSQQGEETVNIREKKTASAFTVEYVDTGAVLYYKANGDNTDYYVIVPDEAEQAHSVLSGKKFSSLSSMFMKLSAVDETLAQQSNVLYMYDEKIAGRSCHKYIQRAYSGGELTQTVYVWIDSQYGFAAKCEAYDAAEKLVSLWEISEFETGKLSDADVELDLSGYEFVEEVG